MTMAKTSPAGEDQKKMIAVAVFVVIAAAIIYFEYFHTGTPSTPAPVATVTVAPSRTIEGTPAAANGKPARSLGTTSAALDPTLHMDAMLVSESVQYAGFGRNIFSPNSAPPPMAIPQPQGKARPQQVAVLPPTPPPAPI